MKSQPASSPVRGDVLQPAPRRGARPRVHVAAHVDPLATLGDDVEVGPGTVIGPEVRIGHRVRIGSHAVLTGALEIGDDARIFHGAVIGEEPQDRAYDPSEPSSVRVGPRTHVREYVTIHRGTGAGTETVVGADVLLMAQSHVAHNCRVDDHAILGGGALLAGHVHVGPRALVSGNAVVHQFVRIGRLVMVGGGSRVARDVPPFALLVGDSQLRGLNGVGIRRNGIERQAQVELRALYRRLLAGPAIVPDAIAEVAERASTPEGRELAEFLTGPSKRGFCGKA